MAGSVAIVGAGQIGHAAWYCVGDDLNIPSQIHARSMPEWMTDLSGDFHNYVLDASSAPEADVVLDTIAFDAEDIERYDPDKVGRLIVVSSASVYCDDQGRTLDEAAQNGFPEFDRPITEEQTTVAPGPDTYSTRKIRMENKALEMFGDRATILRPCAIYGPHSRHPREWWFVKRMLDGRERIPLLYDGRSQFQTSNADLIGNFVAATIEHDLGGVYNIADALAPTVYEIGTAIARIMEREISFELETGQEDGLVGRTPWSVPKPFIVDASKAMRAGSLARIEFGVEAEPAIQWLRDLNPSDWQAAFPQLAAYTWDMFDYQAEDSFLATL